MLEFEGSGLLLMDGARRGEDDGPAEVASTTGSAVAALVESVREGDREAFERLYELHAPLVHGILLARVPYDEVGDLVQDVFLVAFKELKGLRDGSRFGPWVATVARRRAADFHRRARQTEELPEDLAHASRPTAEALEVLEMIRNMPEAYRETLVLRLVEGMTGPEIAERTGLRPASVRVNLHRGMKLLRERLGVEARA